MAERESAARRHARCDLIRMCLADVGLDPERMVCGVDVCALASGAGTEGLPQDEVDDLTDRAIALMEVEP